MLRSNAEAAPGPPFFALWGIETAEGTSIICYTQFLIIPGNIFLERRCTPVFDGILKTGSYLQQSDDLKEVKITEETPPGSNHKISVVLCRR
jgi:hypothetical protein